MYLDEEEKAAGRENFFTAIGSDLIDAQGTSRRAFLKDAIAAGMLVKGGLAAHCFGYQSVKEPLRVGIIGTGDQGGVLIGMLEPEFVAVQAISDIRPYNIHRAFHGDCASEMAFKIRCGLMKKYDFKTEDEARKRIAVYDDYRDLLADESIEAVIIALPLHLHAAVAIAAMKTGKHVFVEKLMAGSVHACKEMARFAKTTNLIVATGHHRHYSVIYDNAAELIRQGVLGKLHFIRAQWHRSNMPGRDSWQPPLPPGTKPDDLEGKELELRLRAYHRALDRAVDLTAVDRYTRRIVQVESQISDRIVDAEKHGYQSHQIHDGRGNIIYDCPPLEELIRWRLWHRTSGGLVSELGVHQVSAIALLLAASHGGESVHPLSVSASSARPLFPPEREVDDHFYCSMDFPAPEYDARDPHARRDTVGVQLSVINGNGFESYGETVYGTEGTLIVQRELDALLFGNFGKTNKMRVSASKTEPKLLRDANGDPDSMDIGRRATAHADRGYTEQLSHWAWCIRNRAKENQPRCHPEHALANAVVALTAEMSAAKRQRIDFRDSWFDINSDETPEGVRPDLKQYA